ncbi:acyl-CoA thioesterase [Novosphingobium album (ex Liu et al. 2023)]|uniref:Thioesterase family protein n=1 Tax=Novosphingobium album (ex Liu et al. 2023) TaxID=3031130 RepID=A0ABT5WWW6_9SPHN|nr:thioesterase family protein [Novosphingobium album (ex Liu et al. 2023)]MDE8654362.1 thioesterase family protein [Novosphingobium album (ex Liu et al. 2023)]
MSGFAAVIAAARPVPQGLCVDIPETWHQGRTAYGGFSSALALVAAMRAGTALPPLRSAQMAMIAPLSGQVAATAQVLRQGRNATWIEARIAGEKGVGFSASFAFMGPVASTLAIDHRPMPAGVNPPEQGAALSTERGVAFLRNHFDVRFALPRAAAKQPEMCWWVRPRERDGLDPMVELLLCADALPPGVMPLLAPGVPVSTMHWQVNLLAPAPTTRDGWWLLRSTGDYAQAGCSSQRMAIWNTQGVPMAAGTQSIALFG